MDLIAARWRYTGSIFLIAAPDLAARTIEPGKLLTFLRGRLGSLFVHHQTELGRRLAAFDERRDPDGRFRIAELFCAGDVWRAAVQLLMTEAHVVVMDLRSFGPEHQGCVFELQTLLDNVPLERSILLVDRGTQHPFLKQVLDTRWQELRIDSRNARTAAPTVRADRSERLGESGCPAPDADRRRDRARRTISRRSCRPRPPAHIPRNLRTSPDHDLHLSPPVA